MTDVTTERPTPLSLFGQSWVDRPPAPITIKPKQQALTVYESIFNQPRKRPEIGAYELIDLEPGVCRYPSGEGPFLFCGAPVAGERCYCAEHHRIAYRRRG